jgi:ketosteroid isomerase-like protein
MSQEQVQDAQRHSSPKVVFERMIQSANRHDLEAMLAFFAPDYRSEQPFYPERSFVGPEGVRNNWNYFFTTIPDIQIDILNAVETGDTIWAELHFHGMRTDGKPHNVKGVVLEGIRANQIIWARLYIESVQEPD